MPAMPRTWPSIRRRRVRQAVWTACRMVDIYPLGVYLGKRNRKTTPMTRYTCPMHPEINGSEGERCPRCNMALVPEGAAAVHGHYGHSHHAPAAGAPASCCH